MFRAEHYFDNHMEYRHGNETKAGATLCLANLCPILHCEFFFPNKESVSPGDHQEGKCNALQKEYRRTLCEHLAHECFPLEQDRSSHQCFDFFMHTFCASHVCDTNVATKILGSLAVEKEHPLISFTTMVIVGLFVYYCFFCIFGKLPKDPNDHED